MSDPTLISVYDASLILGCSAHTVRRLVERGLLQGVPLPGGRKLWLRREQVQAVKDTMLRTAAAQRQQRERDRQELYQAWLDI